MSDVKIRVTAEDKASATLKKVDSALGGMAKSAKASSGQIGTAGKAISGAFGQVAQEVTDTSGAFTALTGISLGTGAAFLALGAGIAKTAQYFKSAVTETVAYGQSIRELSNIIGASTSETSRMVQVADDFMIDIGSMTTALKFATKNGFEPSIESLAQLADQFNALSDPNERAAMLVEKFGRNWAALVPMLSAGGEAIRQNARDVQDALIFDEADTAGILEYQQSLDSFNDTLDATKFRIGQELIPVLNDLLSAFNSDAQMADQMVESFKAFDGILNQSNKSALAMEYAFKQGFDIDPSGLAAIVKELNAIEDPLLRNARAAEIFGENWRVILPMLVAGTGEVDRLAGALSGAEGSATGAAGGIDATTEALEAMAVAAKNAYDAFVSGIKGSSMPLSMQNDLIAEFATGVADANPTLAVFANTAGMLGDALKAGVISWSEYIQYMQSGKDGVIDIDDATLNYIDSQVDLTKAKKKAIDTEKDFTTALQESAAQMVRNEARSAQAAEAARDYADTVLQVAEDLKGIGTRERGKTIFQWLSEDIENLPAGKIQERLKLLEEIGVKVGEFSKRSLAEAKAQPILTQIFGQLGPGEWDKAFAAWDNFIKNFTGTEIPDEAFADIFKDVLSPEQIANALKIDDTSADAVKASAGELATLVADEFKAALGEMDFGDASPATLILGEEEQLATAAENYSGIADSVGVIAAGVPLMKDLGTVIGDAGENSSNAVGPVDDLALKIEKLSVAESRTEMLRKFDSAVSSIIGTASNAAAAVGALVSAIEGLKDKTITITVNTSGLNLLSLMTSQIDNPFQFQQGGEVNLPGGTGAGRMILAATGERVSKESRWGSEDYIVPSGFAADTYPILVRPGEHVVITPASKIDRQMREMLAHAAQGFDKDILGPIREMPGMEKFNAGPLDWRNPMHAAQGADFIVPGGYAADSFPLYVSSGERVTVTPASEVAGDIYYNMTINSLPSQSPTQIANAVVWRLNEQQKLSRSAGAGYAGY